MAYAGLLPKFLQVRALEAAIPLTTVATSGAINNQSATATSGIRFSAATSITGFVAPAAPVTDGKSLIVANVNSADLLLVHQSASSTAANRMDLGGSDITLLPGMAIEIFYDSTTGRWRAKGGTGGGSGAGTGIRNYLQEWWDGTKSVGTVVTTTDSAGVTDRSASVSQWATSDATKVTFEQVAAGALRGSKNYQITHVATGSGVFIESPIFRLDDLDKGNTNLDKQVTISFDIAGLSAGDVWDVYLRTWNSSYVLQSTKISTFGGEEQFGLAPITSYLPECSVAATFKRNFSLYFQPDSGFQYYSLVFRRVSGSNANNIQLDSLFIGPKQLVENLGDSQTTELFGASSLATMTKSALEGTVLERAIYNEPNYMAAWYTGNRKVQQVQDGVGNSYASSTRTASTLNRKKWGSSNTAQISVTRQGSDASGALRGENGQGELLITSPATGSNVFVESPLFYISSVDLGKPMMIQFDYANSNATQIHDVLIARYNNSGVLQEELPISGGIGGSAGTPSSALLGKDGFKGQFTGFFIPTSTSNDQYALRIRRVTGGSGSSIQIAGLYIGRQKTTQGNAITDSIAGTVTQSNFGTTTNNSFFYRRVGDRMIGRATWENGTVVAAPVSMTLPSGINIDDAKMFSTDGQHIVGRAQRIRSGGSPASAQIVDVFYDGVNTNQLFFSIQSASDALSKSNGGDWASNSDYVYVEFDIPVVGWSSNITMADRAVEEFAYNTGTWDSDNTSAFASGAAGQAMGGTLTAVRTKRVRFNTSIQPTDSIHVEFSENQITWVPANDGLVNNTYVVKSTNSAGDLASGVSYSRVSGTTTDLDVAFGQYVRIANDDSPVVNWPSSNAFWRVRKIAGGALVGYGAAKIPTITTLTTGSGTYTTPAGAVRLRVRMVGGGGGGGGTTNGTGGGNTTFGTLTCNGGNGTSGTTPGVGGNAVAVGAGFSGVSLVGSSGGAGTAFNGTNNLIYAKGGDGGPSAFGGQGGGGDSNVTGGSGGTNTGSGGGGGGIKNIGSGTPSGAGGGSGSYVDVVSVGTIASTYSYAVGGGGTGGGTNTNVFGGGNGGSGIIIVEEFYI